MLPEPAPNRRSPDRRDPDRRDPDRRDPDRTTLIAVTAAVLAGVVALIQLRQGVLQILDTGSYLSGAAAFRSGHPLTSTLAPSFSNFDVIQFLERGGRLPFVDFPIGYATVSGILGLVVGARRALALVVIVATAALAALIVIGPKQGRYAATPVMRGVFAVLVVGLPVYRLVVQGALSEPLFCAVLVAFAIQLLRYRASGDGLRPMAILGGSLGLLRFLGGSLAVLPAIEHYRRNRDVGKALGLAAACAAPTALNVLWAGAVGGGHTSAWHGLDRRDFRLVARSISGMFEAHTGDLARTLLSVGDQLPWWGKPVGLLWAAAVVLAAAQYLGVLRRTVLPLPLEICLTLAGLLTVTLLAGLAAFDALATPDNRIMLPAGLLTLCGIVWSVDLPARRGWLAVVAVGLWALPAVRPWDVGHLFDQPGRLDGASQFAGLDASVIVSNDADGVYFSTGKPAVYLPPDRMALTDEPVDRAALFAALPCALAENDGAVVVFPNAMFGVLGQEELDQLVSDGQLVMDARRGGVVYRAADSLSCG